MIRLTILDSLDLRAADGTVLGAVLAQPKRTGLLLYLSLAGRRGYVRRDTLLALLWPEAPTDKARNSLRQAVHQLRRALGESAVRGRGIEELGISGQDLWCDALEFEDRLAQGEAAGALALYRCDLAPGLHVSEAPEFGEWLDGERLRFRRLALRAALKLSQEATDTGLPARATDWARRAVELSPLEEEPARRLIGLLDRQGDRGGALAAYEELVARLARDLDVPPSAETQALVRGIRARVAPQRMAGATEDSRPAPATPLVPSPPPPRPRLPARSRWLVALTVVGLLVIGAVWPFMGSNRRGATGADARTVMVAPFRVSGADPRLGYLREGMLDLLATKFGGGSTLVAADPRAVLAAWRQLAGDPPADLPPEDAVRVAHRLNAGRLLLGAVVGTPDRLTLSARLLDARTGGTRATADVAGPADSLPGLIDRLAAELLIGASGEPPQRLADLASASLPALQAYLAGREAYRRGAYREAVRQLEAATTLDTAFALAWLKLADAQDWATVAGTGDAARRAIALRSRLTEKDRAYIDALLGPRYPVMGTPAERLAAWERVVDVSPDLAEGWYGLGDILFHYGQWLEADSGQLRAESAFERARTLDSAYAAPLAHLVQIQISRGGRAEILRALRQYQAVDSDDDLEEFFRWRGALALGDSAGLAAVRPALRTASLTTLGRIAAWSQLEGVGIGDGLLASRILSERATTDAQRNNAANLRFLVTANAGQFEESRRASSEAYRLAGQTPALLQPVYNALYWEADTAPAAALLRTPAIQAAMARDPSLATYGLVWDYRYGLPVEPRRLEQVLAALGAHPGGGSPESMAVTELRAIAACATGSPRAADATRALAEALAHAGDDWQRLTPIQLVLAHCHERLGDPRSALRVVQRRPMHQWSGLPLLPTFLREEGRYAAMVGDTVTAVRAYRRYLTLRAFAESGARTGGAQVQAALAALERR